MHGILQNLLVNETNSGFRFHISLTTKGLIVKTSFVSSLLIFFFVLSQIPMAEENNTILVYLSTLSKP